MLKFWLFWCNIGFWMIKIKRKCREIERKSFGAKTGQKQGSVRFRSLCEIGTLLRNQFAAQLPSLRKFSQLRNQFWHTSATSQHRSPHFAAVKRLRSSKAWKFPISQPKLHSAGYFVAAKHILAHECHFAAQWPSFRSCETTAKSQSVKTPNFAAKASFRRVFHGCETTFTIWKPRTLISQLRNGCETLTP